MSAADVTPTSIARIRRSGLRMIAGVHVDDLLEAVEERDQLRAELSRLRSAPVALDFPVRSSAREATQDAFATGIGVYQIPAPVAVEVPRVCETCARGRGDAGNGETCMYCRADNYCNWTALRSLASLNPIDPSRILKDGERAVPEGVEQSARICVYEGLSHHDSTHLVPSESLRLALISLRDALRSGEAEGRMG